MRHLDNKLQPSSAAQVVPSWRLLQPLQPATKVCRMASFCWAEPHACLNCTMLPTLRRGTPFQTVDKALLLGWYNVQQS
jgi:hypothetical protein